MTKELPPNLRVSTMTATSKINSMINIGLAYTHLELDDNIRFIEYSDKPSRGFHHKFISEKKKKKKKVFYNQITILVVVGGDTNNIKLFNNGSISMTGVKSKETGQKAVRILYEKLKNTHDEKGMSVFDNMECDVEHFNVVLINSDYDIGYEIKRSELHQILVTQYKIFSSFEPCIYPGVNSKYFWNTAYLENEFKGIQKELDTTIEVASLILVYNTPISVHFRMDEKQFDIEGAYNARYEIIKKRVDKAHIKGTNERITRPGSLVIVYSQEQDAHEYRTYLKFLTAKGFIKEGIEDVALEDLQGVFGLRALRVEIAYSSGLTIDELIKEMEVKVED